MQFALHVNLSSQTLRRSVPYHNTWLSLQKAPSQLRDWLFGVLFIALHYSAGAGPI